MTTLYAEIDKKKISDMPQAQFPGRIVVIGTAESAQKACEYLKKETILGIDTETKPSFKKGTINRVALLQVSTHDVCFLFRLNKMGVPDCLKELLANKKQLKVGLSLKDDIHALGERDVKEKGRYVNLQDYVLKFGILDKSLQKLFANVFGRRISKSQQLSNWEAGVLSRAQELYAATDAWACIEIYERLQQLAKNRDYRFIPRVDENEKMMSVVADLLNQTKQ